MPHPNPEAPGAAEPRSYAAADVYDATLAPPAAGEMADCVDEGEAPDVPGQQLGRTRAGDQRVLRAGAAD